MEVGAKSKSNPSIEFMRAICMYMQDTVELMQVQAQPPPVPTYPSDIPYATDFYQPQYDIQHNIYPEYQYNPNLAGIDPASPFQPYTGDYQSEFEDEPPLIEELGINFKHIFRKTFIVLFPFLNSGNNLLIDEDFSGPIIFGLILGLVQLLFGRVHFGYIYGVGITGSILIYVFLNLISDTGLNFLSTVSVLGYCLLPIDILSILSTTVPRFVLQMIAPFFILWSALSASLLCVIGASLVQQRSLVAYPLFLFYASFALLNVF
ncbi:protein YIPF5 homolog [Schistocerca gregaria]|uniref:protein YIPF5 homolog n=1 Tax=Schistocerca gregaria TaxID=7010 RepID=UPI00211DBF70|nr:protein YIPF5 homolog [Schistocerca gregaria]